MRSRTIKRWKIAGAGYLVLLVAAAGYFGAALIIEDPGQLTRIIFGGLLAGPLVVAFLSERIRKLRLWGFEIELGQVTVDVAEADPKLEDAIAAQQYYSGMEALLEKVTRAIEVPNKRVLEINLRTEPYWWSTRIFLQAALLDDRSSTSHIVFVDGDEQRRFVGIAETRSVRHAFAERMPSLEINYRRLAAENLPTDTLIQRWVGELFDGQQEIDAKTLISSRELRAVLGPRLDSSCVERDDRLDREIYKEILDHPGHLVPVVQSGRLERIVDADQLARRLARTAP